MMWEVKAVAAVSTTCSLTAIVSCLVVLYGLFQEMDDIELQVFLIFLQMEILSLYFLKE